MRLLVTGGAGFIGGHAVKNFLSNNDQVLVLDKLTYAAKKENLDFADLLRIDICDTERVLKATENFKPDCIVHFAAETHVDNSIENCREFIHSNVEGVASILDVCRKAKIKLCHISTDEVYGPASSKAFVEEDSLNPMNPYAVTKASGDMMIKSFENTYGLQYVIIRPSNNYGPKQHQEKFIPKLLTCLDNEKTFPLYGSGDQIREWTFVEDTAKIIRDVITSSSLKWNETYNLSSGISYTNIETAKKVIETYNRLKNKNFEAKDVLKISEDRPGHDRRYWISSKKLNYFVDTNYTEFQLGIEKTILDHVKQ